MISRKNVLIPTTSAVFVLVFDTPMIKCRQVKYKLAVFKPRAETTAQTGPDTYYTNREITR